MPGAPGSHLEVVPNTSKTPGAATKVRYDLSQLASLAGPPPRKTYVREFVLNVDPVLTNGAGTTQTIAWQQLYTVIQSCILQMQGHQWLNLPYNGGDSIRRLNFLMFGKAPSVGPGTTLSWATTGNGGLITTFGPNLKFIIPCFDPRGIVAEEDMIPVGLLLGASLEFVTCAAANFGSNFTITSTTFRKLTAELIQRDEVRYPALWAWEERVQSSLSDYISPEGVLYTDIYAVSNPSTGQTYAGYTTSQLTSVIFTQTGMKTADNLAPNDLISLYNSQQGVSSEGYLADWENTGVADTVPLQYLPRQSGKKTHLQADMNKPYFQGTGTLATTAFRMLLHYYKPLGPRGVADLAAKANQPLPNGFAETPRKFLRPKSPAKVAIDPAKAQFLAQKVVIPKPTPAAS